MRKRALGAGLVVAMLPSVALFPSEAGAEGTAELGVTQRLQNPTQVWAEVAAVGETVCWTGNGSATVFNPDATTLATILPGTCATATAVGAHRIAIAQNQLAAWDFSVRSGGVGIPGRVFAPAWYFDASSFAEASSTDGSFFALLPGGGPGTDTVVELALDGLAGFIYIIGANETGVDGPNAGRSVPIAGNNFFPSLPLYLNPPDLASYNPLTPIITNFDYSGGAADCNEVSPGLTTGTFTFDSNVTGTFHLECDLDQDGIFDIVDPDDLLVIGTASPGSNSVTWGGTDNSGDPVAPGSYDCRVSLNIGEFHYVGVDMETSYQGLRLFEVAGSLARTPLRMYWNDSLVQAGEGLMPNGDVSPVTSPPNGLDSGSFASVATPHGNTNAGNARAWGNFNSAGTSKGNDTLLDTFSVARTDVSAAITIVVVDATLDSDGEGVVDVIEDCELGTSHDLPDTDGDGIDDFVESNGGTPVDTDGDMTIDALDDDSDDDGVDDSVEGAVDTDGDSVDDYRDDDADNDGVIDGVDVAFTDPDLCADVDGDGCDDCSVGTDDFGPLADTLPLDDGPDADGDGQCDDGDADDDNDGVLDGEDGDPDDPSICEDVDGDGCDDCAVGDDGFGPNPDNDPGDDGPDTDADGQCDPGDPDDDGDGVDDDDDLDPLDPTVCSDVDGDSCDDCSENQMQTPDDDGPDSDGDGICDPGEDDPDSDGDGVRDADDVCPAVADPAQNDSDGDGIGDACEDVNYTSGDTQQEGACACSTPGQSRGDGLAALAALALLALAAGRRKRATT
jgi:MYXO-CTERM domain-containing protein